MHVVDMREAESRLSALVEAVESGREAEAVIARNGKPAARLAPIAMPDVSSRIGIAEGEFTMPDDWNKHDEEIAITHASGTRRGDPMPVSGRRARAVRAVGL